jgi:predicted DNA-binding transcriptional regulator AlpA
MDQRQNKVTAIGEDAHMPLLLTVEDVAELLCISVRSVWRLHSAKKLPRPVRLAGSVRWRRHELEKWVDGGCGPQENGK